MLFVIAFLSLIALILLHEMGHFFMAKKFGVKVEEVGIGIPPRIFGIQRGETLYSLNWLPLGAFVRLQGEEDATEGPRSFRSKPIWQRFCIVSAGVVAFWIITAFILGILGATTGVPMQIDDEDLGALSPMVQIVGVAPDSPAEAAGVEAGDFLLQVEQRETDTIEGVQAEVASHLGKEVVLSIQRQGEMIEVNLVPRENPPADEGALGVALVRTGLVRHSWLQAPFQGALLTGKLTVTIIKGFGMFFSSLLQGEGVPGGMRIMGPLGILNTLQGSLSVGIPYYFYFLSLLSVYLALFNALPIPAVDGGRLLFLGIEAIRRKPLPERIESGMNTVVFVALLIVMIWVTIKDIARIF